MVFLPENLLSGQVREPLGVYVRFPPGGHETEESLLAAWLADAGVNVEMISTSEIRISVVTRADVAQTAVQALHTAFGLDADGEAVVYAGTGR